MSRSIRVAVYHFTPHAYRSWRPDHPRGYVHHTNGLLPPDPMAAKWYDAQAKFEPTIFDEKVQRLLYRGTSEICRNRHWRFHGGASDPTHFHILVSWIEFVSCQDVLVRMKNVLSYILGQEIGPKGRKWFVRGGSKRRVKDRAHFDICSTSIFRIIEGWFGAKGNRCLDRMVRGLPPSAWKCLI